MTHAGRGVYPYLPMATNAHVFGLYSLPIIFSKAKSGPEPVGNWISVPSPNFVVMATRVGPQHFAWFR